MAFHDYLKRYQIEMKKQMLNDVTNLLKEAWDDILTKSPVRTGDFKRNWRMSSATVGGMTEPNFKMFANHIMQDRSVYIHNDLPYAWRLEYGWSKQAPAGMIRITKAKIERKLR